MLDLDHLIKMKKLDGKYNKLIEANEDGETSIIFVDGEDEPLKAIIIAGKDKEDCQMIVIEGKLNIDQLDTIFETMGSLGD